jgi:hypothetical protein
MKGWDTLVYPVGPQMAVKLLALRLGRPLPPASFLVLLSVRGSVDPGAIAQLEVLGHLRNALISSGV